MILLVWLFCFWLIKAGAVITGTAVGVLATIGWMLQLTGAKKK